uniref:Alpha-ketoglutarate-dependent dioxygenase AlkB-like domain-containing protein n=1 Tax=Amphiprion ocellaris TaxID=80972 RepID=A0AAQ5XR23_AMPOC
MRLLGTVLKQIHKPAVYSTHRRRLSSRATGGPSPLRVEAPVVGSNRELVLSLGLQVEVRTGFITEEEEAALLQELEPGLRRKRYEFDHWDDTRKQYFLVPVNEDNRRVKVTGRLDQAIHGYRETERVTWGAACEEILTRVRSAAFPEGSSLLGPVHVLDLDKAGYIKPHIDSVKFCGSTIAGLSLLSDSIMRLVKEDDSSEWLDLLLSRRSLYILRDQARYQYTHEILKDEESVFNGQKVPRQRRISVICRNLPG